jgi:hypothetical protein
MATENPTGDGATVPLDLFEEQRRYLHRALADCKAGREDDLQTYPDHPNARRWHADADGYERLITGLDAGEIAPDDRVRELAAANDREEEYERVVFEHDALAALREQIGAGQ